MYTDEERVRSLSRREVSVIYLTCQDKSLSEIAELIHRSVKLVQHYRTKSYKKLELTDFPDEDKITYLKRLYCPILEKYIKTSKDVENWVPIEPKTGNALLIVEVEKIEDEEERSLALKDETPIVVVPPFQPPTAPQEPPRRFPYWIIIVIAIAAVIIVYLLRPQPQERITETVIVTFPPVVITQAPEPSATAPVEAYEPPAEPTQALPTETTIPTELPTNTPEPSPTKDPLNLGFPDSYSDERVTLTAARLKFNQNYYGRSAIWIGFDFENHSGEDILLRFNASDFTLQDNEGRYYDCWYIMRYPNTASEVNRTISNGSVYDFVLGCGKGIVFDVRVETVVLSIDQFSSLPSMAWTIEIPR